MFHLITGRSGSGKTEQLRAALGTLAAEGNSRLILLVPEQYSFDNERYMLEKFGDAVAQNIEVLSFTRLADFVCKELNEPAGQDPGDGTKILFMLRAMNMVQDKLEYYGDHAASVPLAKQLVQESKAIQQSAVLLEQLEALAAETARPRFAQKLRDIVLIFSAYNALISEQYPLSGNTLERLCTLLDESHLLEGYTVGIDGFKGYTMQELHVIKRLMRQCEDVYMTSCTEDPYGADPSLLFSSVNQTAKQCIAIAKESGTSVKIHKSETEGIRYTNPALKHLEKNFFTSLERPFDTGSNGSPDAVTVITAQTVQEECTFIAATIRHLLREEHYRCKDIAVIVRNEEDYRRELLTAFRRYEIPVFEDSRQPIQYQPLVVLCRTVLRLACSFTTEQFLLYLKTGLTPLEEKDVADLENYILQWEIRGSELLEPFTHNPKGLGREEDEQSKKLLESLEKSRRTAVDPLRPLMDCRQKGTYKKYGTLLYQLLEKTRVGDKLYSIAATYSEEAKIGLANEQDATWRIVMQTVDLLSSVYGEEGQNLSNYTAHFDAVLSVTTLGSIPQSLDEVAVGSADRMRLSAPKAVFVAGCAEGVFPAGAQNSGLFSRRDQEELSRNGIEIDISQEQLTAEERFTAYSAVSAPSEKVFLSYHRVDPAGAALLPSGIINSVRELFPEDLSDRDADSYSPLYYCETKESAFHTYAELLTRNTEQSRSDAYTIRQVLSKDPDMDARLRAVEAATSKTQFRIEDKKIAEGLFGKDMGLSASRVDKYHRCPFEYFCEFGMEAQPRRPAKLDPSQTGTVVHWILEHLVKETGMDTLIHMSQKERHEEVDRWLSVYLEHFMGGAGDKTERFRYLYHRLSVSLYEITDRLCLEFEQSEFKPTDFELKIGDEENGIPSYRLDLGEKGSIRIGGSIDRVDTYEKDGVTYIRVVDYKTGTKTFKLNDILYGLNMQMLIYLFAVEDEGKARYGENKPAGILYYPAKRVSISQASHKEPSADEMAEQKKINHGSGLFLLDENTLEAMEKDLGGCYIPIEIGKKGKSKGNPVGNLITPQRMEQLHGQIDLILSEMHDSLLEGHIEAYPANGSDYEHTCDYCDYKVVCGTEGEQSYPIKTDYSFEKLLENLETGIPVKKRYPEEEKEVTENGNEMDD